jgi:hypothetical protein
MQCDIPYILEVFSKNYMSYIMERRKYLLMRIHNGTSI